MNYIEQATESKTFGINPGKYDLMVVGDAGRFEKDQSGAYTKVSEESFTMGTTKTGEPDPKFTLTLRVVKDYQGGGQEGKEVTEYFSLNAQQFKLPILGAALYGSATLYKQVLAQTIQEYNINPEDAENVVAAIIAVWKDQVFTGEYVAKTREKIEWEKDQFGVRTEVRTGQMVTDVNLAWFAKDGGTPPQAIFEPQGQAPVQQAPVPPAAATSAPIQKPVSNTIKPKVNGLPNASALNDNALSTNDIDEDAVLFED